MPAVLLIIPCYRERDRLPTFLPELCAATRGVPGLRLRVVDDGSGTEQQKWLSDYVESLRPDCPALEPTQLNPKNLGKGGAVYSGWDLPGDAQLLGFVDADGAIAVPEIVRLLASLENPAEAVYAVRTGQSGTVVRRAFYRRVAGQIFRRIVRRLFSFPVPDTQCGFKLVPAAAYRSIRDRLKEERFTFDVELTWHLLHAGIKVRPVPINWTERPGSRLRAAGVLAMYCSLQTLRRNLGDWRPS